MVRVIDLEDRGLTAEQVLDCIQRPEGALLRRNGRVVARIEAADDVDLDDERWAQAPEQVARGQAARERFEKGESIAHEDVKRMISE